MLTRGSQQKYESFGRQIDSPSKSLRKSYTFNQSLPIHRSKRSRRRNQQLANRKIKKRQRQSNMNRVHAILTLILALTFSLVGAFAPTLASTNRLAFQPRKLAATEGSSADESEVIARRIIVTGDVQGGYYRSCVLNEVGWNPIHVPHCPHCERRFCFSHILYTLFLQASRFRRLVGTMSPPDDTSEAEIYVEVSYVYL